MTKELDKLLNEAELNLGESRLSSGSRRLSESGYDEGGFDKDGLELAKLLGKKWRGVKYDRKKHEGRVKLWMGLTLVWQPHSNEPGVYVQIEGTSFRQKGVPEQVVKFVDGLSKAVNSAF